jgi:tRNA pseudouridine55 synthase
MKPARRAVDGVLLLDKPTGITSNAALQRVKRLYRAQKAGHTGTLDPLASGLLPICLGQATKFAQWLLDAPKAYRASIRFGVATSTGDAEGAVVAEGPGHFPAERIAAALALFVGAISQVPPRYAALKRDGKPYYAYAREGVEIERTPRAVLIHALTLVDVTGDIATVEVRCSKGTYVRTLAEDVGTALGSCAHLCGLRRTASAGFDLTHALTLPDLEALDEDGRDARLLPMDTLLGSLPALTVGETDARALAHGRTPRSDVPAGRYRCYGPAGLAGVVDATGAALVAVRLLAPRGDVSG